MRRAPRAGPAPVCAVAAPLAPRAPGRRRRRRRRAGARRRRGAGAVTTAKGTRRRRRAAARRRRCRSPATSTSGFANAQGNGTSFAPGDTRAARRLRRRRVRARGELARRRRLDRLAAAASRTASCRARWASAGGRRSSQHASSVDLRYTPRGAPLMVFSRVQLLPRFTGAGDATRVAAASRRSAG